MNETFLDYEADIINESVFESAHLLYTDLAIQNSQNEVLFDFFEADLSRDHITPTRLDLSSYLFSREEILQDVAVYNVDHAVLVSAKKGVRYLDLPSNRGLIEKTLISNYLSGDSGGWVCSVHENGEKTITYIGRAFSLNSVSGGIVLITLRPNTLTDMLMRLGSNGFDAYLMDTVGQCAAATTLDVVGAETEAYLKNVVPGNASYLTLDGNHVFTRCTELPESDWRLICIADYDAFYEPISSVVFYLAITTVLTIFLGLLVTLYLSHRTKRPLDHILTRFAPSDSRLYNEYALLDTTLNELSERVSDLSTQFEKYLPEIKSNFLRALLCGRVSSQKELDEYCDLLGLHLSGPHYACVLIETEETVAGDFDLSRRQTIRYLMMEEIERHFEHGINLYCTHLENNRLIAVVSASQPDHPKILRIAASVVQSAADAFGSQAFVLLSRWVKSVEELHTACQEMLSLSGARFFSLDQSISTVDAWASRDSVQIPDSFWRSLEKVSALTDDEMTRLHDKIGQLTLQLPLRACEELMYRYIQWLTAQIQKTSANEALLKRLQAPQSSFWNLRDMLQIIRLQISMKAEKNDPQTSPAEQQIDLLKHYIEENLSQDLSLDTLASIVYLSPKYLSRLFKSVTNETLSSYINTRRMEYAKKLLLETELRIEEVAKLVGFTNSVYFIQKFKENTGVTPRSFRIIDKNDAEEDDELE